MMMMMMCHSNSSSSGNNTFFTSSMKLSKSILSPGRAAVRDGAAAAAQASLSSSLSRRLRSNGSVKGSQTSPFLAVTGKKRGCSFENPEPSSPKVTCIGQVRVKTKKKKKKNKAKQSRSLSRRNGEVSFRKLDQQQQQQQRFSNAGAAAAGAPLESQCHRNQRWVHLPVSICEALRSLGTDLNCLFPCRSDSSCLSAKGKATAAAAAEEEEGGAGSDDGCGAVFARWLVSVNDGEGGRRREIELVVGGGEETAKAARSSGRRRHVFEDIEVKDNNRIEVRGQKSEENNGGRVSICIPPKNALLLMRCRSDPVKMAALTNRFSWDRPKHDDEEPEEEQEEPYNFLGFKKQEEKQGAVPRLEEGPIDAAAEEEQIERELLQEIEDLLVVAAAGEEEEEEEEESNMSSFDALLVLDHHETTSADNSVEEEEEEDCPTEEDDEGTHLSTAPPHTQEEPAPLKHHHHFEATAEEPATATAAVADPPTTTTHMKIEDPEEKSVLPECLLLMMCEPKLSMEVSKETWVCRTDFIRWLPERPRRPSAKAAPATKDSHHEQQQQPPPPPPVIKTRLSTDSTTNPKQLNNPPPPPPPPPPVRENDDSQQQPHRSSCSLPAASMATIIERKLVNAVGYEPFVLTRCKSEPMRTAAAKLMPATATEACHWKNAMKQKKKMEPHHRGPATLGF